MLTNLVFGREASGGKAPVPGIPATPDHIPGMLAVQDSCALETKLRAGMCRDAIERDGFLVHKLTGAQFEGLLASEGVLARVVQDANNDVAGYAICCLLSSWKKKNPEWFDAIRFHDGVAPGPSDDETILFRYAAIGPTASSGTGMRLTGGIVTTLTQWGCRAILCESLLSPFYNKPAHLTYGRRQKGKDVGRIYETYEGDLYEWALYRRLL